MGDMMFPLVSILDTVFTQLLLTLSPIFQTYNVCRLYFMLLLQCLLLREIQALWRWIAKLCNLPVAYCILLLVYQVLCSLLNFHSLYKSNFPLTYIGVCLSEKEVQMVDSAHLWLRWQIDWECYYIWGKVVFLIHLICMHSHLMVRTNRYVLTVRKMGVNTFFFSEYT